MSVCLLGQQGVEHAMLHTARQASGCPRLSAQDLKCLQTLFCLVSIGATEEVIAANSVDSAIQQVVGEGGQRVITIVTDQQGNLQPATLGQKFFVTMQGQQSEFLDRILSWELVN